MRTTSRSWCVRVVSRGSEHVRAIHLSRSERHFEKCRSTLDAPILFESIRRFPKPDAFRRMIADAGFANARAEPMLGGLVCIWSGWKI